MRVPPPTGPGKGAPRRRLYNVDPLVAELRKARLQRGLTLFDLAQHMPVNLQMLSSWETGRTKPTLGSLRRWLDALNLDVQLKERP